MRSSDSLFRLIKAMSKGDRRNFKLFAKLQDGDKKYIQLFDAIDKQDEYDEKALLEQFKGERFTNQFSVAKNYLYNYILKTLHVFHKDQYTDLSTLMHQIQILMGKSLFDQAQKLIRKGKHMAERQERFQEFLTLLGFERGVLDRMKQSKQFQVFFASIHSQEKEALAKIENLQLLHHLYDEIYLLRTTSTVARGKSDKEKVDEILANPLLASVDQALTVRAKLRILFTLNECYFYKNDFANCLQHTLRIIETYEAHPTIRKEQNARFIGSISNYCLFSYRMGQVDESLRMLDKLKNLEVYSEEEKFRVFEKYYHFKIAFSTEICAIEEGAQAIYEFERELKSMDGKIMKSIELGIFYLAGYFYIQAGEPSKALIWINKILNEPKTELRTDIQCMARILNLVVHYELGNRDYVDHNLKSTSRFLSNRGRLFEFERTTLKFLRQLSNLRPSESPNQALHRFGDEMKKVLTDDAEQKALSLFNVLVWIEGRLKDVSMATIITKEYPTISSK